MSKRPGMSKAEMEIARIVWTFKSANARQVHEALPPARKIDFTTVQTYLSRLEKKGYLKSKKSGRTKFFSARANPDRVARDIVKELRNLLFDGDAVPMMRHLVTDAQPNQLESLRAMLNELECEAEN